MNVLIACEESQTICKEFRLRGFNAYSCDLQECSGGHPEWHFKDDALKVIKEKGGNLQSGNSYYIEGNWDLLIAHPPCTYLSVAGNRWMFNPEDKDLPYEQRRPHPLFPDRRKQREEAIKFFMEFVNADVEHIAIENPHGIMGTHYRKCDQMIQPWMFGESFAKRTCFWLKNLPLLQPTNIVDEGGFDIMPSGKRIPSWYSKAGSKDRQKIRSKTFKGIAEAIADQWGNYIKEN